MLSQEGHTMNHTMIYIRDEDKRKLVKKAKEMNMSLSQLMIKAALEYDPQLSDISEEY